MSYADPSPPTMRRQVEMPSSFAFRLLTKDSIPDAIKKSERYRLLGEPDEAESVCFDILQVDPDNQEARVDLILAITDQFGRERRPRVDLAMKVVGELTDEYQRAYYEAAGPRGRRRTHAAQPAGAVAAHGGLRRRRGGRRGGRPGAGRIPPARSGAARRDDAGPGRDRRPRRRAQGQRGAGHPRQRPQR